MATSPLGRLERVKLRDVWPHEADHFTKWLAQPEHLALLSDTVKIKLELHSIEKNVGALRADIVCKNMDDETSDTDNALVLIENQIERTDHKHLGQLLTYAAGLKTVTIIWIAEQFCDEHRAALDWLNDITNEHYRFFGLEIELWRINDSLPAPKFNIVCMPNDWLKETRRLAKEELSDVNRLQLRYWLAFIDYLKQQSSFLKSQRAMPRHWLNFSIGKSGIKIATTAKKQVKRYSKFYNQHFIGVELYIYDERLAKSVYSYLYKHKERIEEEIGHALEWQELPDKKASRIVLYEQGSIENEDDWPRQFEWLMIITEKFDRVFRPRIQSFQAR